MGSPMTEHPCLAGNGSGAGAVPGGESAGPAPPLPAYWAKVIWTLDIAFQPIVDIRTGTRVGVEALVRQTDAAGFASIAEFFDVSHRLGVLQRADAALRDMALAAFARLNGNRPTLMFLNVDARSMDTVSGTVQQIHQQARRQGVPPTSIVIEVPADLQPAGEAAALTRTDTHPPDRCGVAIDGFAAGFMGVPLLYHAEPDYVKVGRPFIRAMVQDPERKDFLRQIIHLARTLGTKVIAVGVETEEEFRICREVGCDLVQGHLLQRPTLRPEDLSHHFPIVEDLNGSHRYRLETGPRPARRGLDDQIEVIAPITVQDSMDTVFERFRAERHRTFFPVTQETGEPVGLVVEERLKEYAYSRFGKELISNRMFGHSLMEFVIPCPTADIGETPERILEIFSGCDNIFGILIVENNVYVGFLHAHMLLRLINERNLARAQDQNPLTRLPGNNAIHEYIERALAHTGNGYHIVYFDFDNFKPFNDKYGFRQGDRAIILFAEILMKEQSTDDAFYGHVGGDDFFIAFENMAEDIAVQAVRRICHRFRSEVESFYDDEARRRGFIVVRDRHGIERNMPLLSVSAGILHLPRARGALTPDHLSSRIAGLKKAAKEDASGLSFMVLAD